MKTDAQGAERENMHNAWKAQVGEKTTTFPQQESPGEKPAPKARGQQPRVVNAE